MYVLYLFQFVRLNDFFIYQYLKQLTIFLFYIHRMIIEQQFISKYRDQYYNKDVTIPDLVKEQKQLYKLLDQLHVKTQSYFDKVCSIAERKGQSERNSTSKENAQKLPALIAGAELKNSQAYRQLLQNQRNVLQKRMNISINLKQKDINQQIKQEKQKVMSLIKKNKTQTLEIQKLGQKLVDEKKTPKQVYQQALHQLKMKKKQNSLNQQKLQSNEKRIQQLKQQISQVQYDLDQYQIVDEPDEIEKKEAEQFEALQKMAPQIKFLQSNRDKLKFLNHSLKNRLSQEYYCKLKQLDTLIKKGEQLDWQLKTMQEKVEQKGQQLSNSMIYS